MAEAGSSIQSDVFLVSPIGFAAVENDEPKLGIIAVKLLQVIGQFFGYGGIEASLAVTGMDHIP